MITYKQPQIYRGSVGQGVDKVFAAIAVPRGGVFHGANIDLKLWALEQVAVNVSMYGITGYAVPILDPDAAATYDAIWDAQVPKNMIQSEGALDLDTGAADTTPEYEPGEVNWAGVFDMEGRPRRLLRVRGSMSFGDDGVGRGPFATGGATHFIPNKSFRFNIRGGFRARRPTAIMFAVSLPALDRTTTTALTSPTEDEWLMLRYLEDTAIDAMKFLIGRVEAGAKTPYTEAAVFLDKTLAPDVYEAAGTQMAVTGFELFSQSKFTMSVPGRMRATLDGDR